MKRSTKTVGGAVAGSAVGVAASRKVKSPVGKVAAIYAGTAAGARLGSGGHPNTNNAKTGIRTSNPHPKRAGSRQPRKPKKM